MIRNYYDNHPEWLNASGRATPEVERDLQDAAGINRRFGGYKIVLDYIVPILERRQPIHLLDLGAGGGDVDRVIVERAREVGCPILVTAVDGREAVVSTAEKLSEGFPEIRYVRDDILTFGDEANYDIAMSNMVLHLLEEHDAIKLLRRCRVLTRGAALLTDLRRSRLAQASILAAAGLFYRGAETRREARLATSRAFSYVELKKLSIAAGWWGFSHRRCPYFRQAIWMDVSARRH